MARKGYSFEYKVKKLFERDGWCMFKLAINSYADFLAMRNSYNDYLAQRDGKLGGHHQCILIECKKKKKDKFRINTPRLRKQYYTLVDLQDKLNIPIFYVIQEKGKIKALTLRELDEQKRIGKPKKKKL